MIRPAMKYTFVPKFRTKIASLVTVFVQIYFCFGKANMVAVKMLMLGLKNAIDIWLRLSSG